MEVARSSETLVSNHHTTRRNNSESHEILRTVGIHTAKHEILPSCYFPEKDTILETYLEMKNPSLKMKFINYNAETDE
jgi:hypothetical protein